MVEMAWPARRRRTQAVVTVPSAAPAGDSVAPAAWVPRRGTRERLGVRRARWGRAETHRAIGRWRGGGKWPRGGASTALSKLWCSPAVDEGPYNTEDEGGG
jgi:hypothetical protein